MAGSKKPFYKSCIVPMCKNTIRNAPDKFYFHVPRNAKVREKWCTAMRRFDQLSTQSCLYCCEDHFNIKEDTQNFIQYQIMALQEGQKTTLRLKADVVPHIFQCQKVNVVVPLTEKKCPLKRKRQALVRKASDFFPLKQSAGQKVPDSLRSISCEAGPSTESDIIDSETTVNYETELNYAPLDVPCNVILQVDKAIQVNSTELCSSKGFNVNFEVKKNSIPLCPFNVTSDHTVDNGLFRSQSSVLPIEYEPDGSPFVTNGESDSNIQFINVMRGAMLSAIEREPKMLLGLPKKSYYLIKLLSENIPLPTINILITLKKIKLNESFSILALHFGYTQSTVSKIFSESIVTIAEKMKELIVWPEPQEIFKNLPLPFRVRYANVVSIIDCLEIQIEKPSDAVHQSLTWSQYKKCHSLKYLISCTPDGVVNFVSSGYGGKATDEIILEDCGFLECLLFLPPNKAVMADRGFKNLPHLLENKNCMLVQPYSVSKSSASTKEDIILSKQTAALRTHVKHVINRLNEFHILQPHTCIDHNLTSLLDEVIVVACGLINVQDILIKVNSL